MRRIVFAFFSFVLTDATATKTQAVRSDTALHLKARRPASNQMLFDFRLQLIEKALVASGKKFVIEDCDVPEGTTSDERYAMLVEAGDACHILVSFSGAKFTSHLALVPIPIYLGGGGYRVFYATKHGVRRTADIKTLHGLSPLRFGSGTSWADSDIMADNGLTVLRANYGNLLDMLEVGRFDLLTRSVFEIGGERQTLLRRPDILVEPNLMMHYPGDLFFYVTRKRNDLQQALSDGMIKLYCSGELDRHIRTHPSTREGFAILASNKRTVIELTNHLLRPDEALALQLFHPGARRLPNAGPARKYQDAALQHHARASLCANNARMLRSRLSSTAISKLENNKGR